MPNPSAVVGRVVRLDPSIEERPRGARTVEIGGDVRATIDAENAKSEGLARLLDGAARLGRPVYLELDLPTGISNPDFSAFAERDPALFTTPVSKATWKSVQKNPSATLTDTDGTYYHWIASQPDDPGYADTNYYLSFYRLKLQARAMQIGAPPYANCL